MNITFEYNLEIELQSYLVDNFEKYFDFNYVCCEYKMPDNGGIIDMVGISNDKQTLYVIELKRESITNETIIQIENYINNLSKLNPYKKVLGIAAAPKFHKNLDKNINSNIKLLKLKGVKYNKSPLFAVSFNQNQKEQFLLSAVKGTNEKTKLLPRGSDLIKISLELYFKTMGVQIPSPILKSIKPKKENNSSKIDKPIVEVKEQQNICEKVVEKVISDCIEDVTIKDEAINIID